MESQSSALNPAAKYSSWQVIALTLLRVVIGWHFLYEGLSKLFTPGWTSAESLQVSKWFLADFFHWIANTPSILIAADVINIWGLIIIGCCLLFGLAGRWASFAGILLLSLYYIANPPFVKPNFGIPSEGNYLIVDKNLVEIFALFVTALFPAGYFWGIDRLFKINPAVKKPTKESKPEEKTAPVAEPLLTHTVQRRELLKGLATLPVAGVFGISLLKKKKWESYEEQNLIDAVTGASIKNFNPAELSDLKGSMPYGKIKDKTMSRIILGGNLMSGWAHSRDLIYVSQLVKAYHHRDKIFATMLMAEKCGVNTLLTNPILCRLIDEYWKRGIGKMQFISDCAGLNYDDKGPSPMPEDQYFDKIKKAIDYGAVATYIQGETADYHIQNGSINVLEKAIQLMHDHRMIIGIGAHHIETIKRCVEIGFEPDFWMKTLHHHNYWSARHTEWHDNMYCFNPQETISFMESLPQPWIAFKVMAAGAIHPNEAFRYAFENGADFVCAGMYDFQVVEDVNIANSILAENLPRKRTWRA
ncbi:MAG TPA: DoxX family protein [Cyclobacteriaceae bacterium]|nr:DoxX family protein [Cyclobacteriaceae bacterium]